MSLPSGSRMSPQMAIPSTGRQCRQAVDAYLKTVGKKPGVFLFTGPRGLGQCMTTRQYARLLSEWIASIGLDPHLFGTHSLRRTKATLLPPDR